MSYKYVGTEQDLIDNGFIKWGDSKDLYIRSTKHPMFTNEKLLINITNRHIGLIDTYFMREVNVYVLKDLIDKDLVVEDD